MPSLDAVHPFVLLLGGGSRDAVEGVVAFHHAAVGLRLAGFDHLVLVVWDEELKAVLQRETGRSEEPMGEHHAKVNLTAKLGFGVRGDVSTVEK